MKKIEPRYIHLISIITVLLITSCKKEPIIKNEDGTVSFEIVENTSTNTIIYEGEVCTPNDVGSAEILNFDVPGISAEIVGNKIQLKPTAIYDFENPSDPKKFSGTFDLVNSKKTKRVTHYTVEGILTDDLSDNTIPTAVNTTGNVTENAPSGTIVLDTAPVDDGIITDAEIIAGGYGQFEINPEGVISVASGANIDYETDSSYLLSIKFTDDDNNHGYQAINISVDNISPDGVIELSYGAQIAGTNTEYLPSGHKFIRIEKTYNDGIVINTDSLVFQDVPNNGAGSPSQGTTKTPSEIRDWYGNITFPTGSVASVFSGIYIYGQLPIGWGGNFSTIANPDFLQYGSYQWDGETIGKILNRFSTDINQDPRHPFSANYSYFFSIGNAYQEAIQQWFAEVQYRIDNGLSPDIFMVAEHATQTQLTE